MKLNGVIWLILVWTVCGHANPEAAFQAGNSAFQKGDYQTAFEQYQAVESAGFHSPELFNNLGLSCWKLNQLGHAILYFERGLKHTPRNAALLQNLDRVKAHINEPVEEIPLFFPIRWWTSLTNLYSSDMWATCAIIFAWLAAGIWIGSILKKIQIRPVLRITLLSATIALSLCCVALGMHRKNLANEKSAAILIVERSSLVAAPEASSLEIQPITEGVKVSIEDQLGEWYKVILPNKEQGWLPKKVLEMI